ncbi:MAG: hypothetical protein EOM87_08640, partial [Clostridia bacterium]|nr:hypothetical protein [Clostridia bacterium]
MPRYTVILIAIMIVSILFVFSACDTTAERTIVTVSIEEGTIVASYTLHQSIELENARLTLTYSDGFTDTVSITEDMLAGFSTANIGTYTLVVEYEGRSATLVYTVTQQDTSITVSSVEPLDFKTEYFVNDVLSVTGAKLRITYSDSVTEDIVVTEGMVTASSFNTKTATGASAPRNMSVSASTRGGLANCMVAYTVLPLATISSFTVTSTPTLIFQKGTATSELTARLSSLSYRVEYSDSTVVNLDFNASYMTITGFSTANTGNYSLSIRYVDNKSRNKSLSLSYQIIEQITEHQVTYDYNYIGVATVDVMTVNGLAPTRPTPTRNGFTFLGWYTKSGEIYSNNPWNFQDRVQQEMTLYARWSKINYTITYVGVANESLNKTHFAQYDIESAFSLYEESREGYVFGGFDKGGGVIVNSITLGSIGNLTLTAVWTPIQYNIVYNLNSGTAPNPNNPSTYNIEDSFTFSAPTRTGYNFTGWKNNADQQTINGISAGRIGALSVTAQWSIINYT